MTDSWPLSIVSLGLLAFIAWREWLHCKLVRDLTAKIKAGSIYEYAVAMEEKPKERKQQAERANAVSDPVLGPTY